MPRPPPKQEHNDWKFPASLQGCDLREPDGVVYPYAVLELAAEGGDQDATFFLHCPVIAPGSK
jgi:hypothetical protein